MRKRIFALVLAMCLVLGLSPGVLAADSGTARVVFEAGQPDANGCFTVDMRIYNATFNAFQFVLWYDDTTVVPVDANGKETDSFRDFAVKQDDGWMATIGTSIDREKGLIDFTGYVTPGESVAVDAESKTGLAIVGESGLKLFTLRFKKVGEQPVVLKVAAEGSGTPWKETLPTGGAVVESGVAAPVTVEFKYPAETGSGGTVDVPQPGKPEPTADQLLKAAIILKIGGHAAVVEGGVTAIYSGEPNVTAYAHDNRTFVPVRFVAERMGADVDWENDTQTAVITKDGHTIRMKVGELTYTLDGVTKQLDVPAEFTPSVNNEFRTMVPVRFVTEALGYQVEWDKDRNLAVIIDPAYGWDPDGSVEAETMDQAVSLLTMYGGFV